MDTMVLQQNGFCELANEELQAADGGGAVAFVYALGFMMGMSPLGAVCVIGLGAVALGVGIYAGLNS